VINLVGTKGTKVMFSNGRDEFAIVFRAAVDDIESISDMVAKLARDGYKPVSHNEVVYTRDLGWVRHEAEPTLRQKLGMRPVLVVS
jgi:hypothetical protein